MNTETVINYAFLRCKAAFKRATYGLFESRHNFTVIIRNGIGFMVSPSRTNCRIYNSQLSMYANTTTRCHCLGIIDFQWIMFPTILQGLIKFYQQPTLRLSRPLSVQVILITRDHYGEDKVPVAGGYRIFMNVVSATEQYKLPQHIIRDYQDI